MSETSRLFAVAAVALSLALGGAVSAENEKAKKDERASLSLRGTPAVSFAPTNVMMIGTLKGGPDDAEEFYCPSIEWDWGDGTVSERSMACPPYVSGTSTIERRYTRQHLFRTAGEYKVRLLLKRNDEVIAAAAAVVSVQPGLGERR